MCLRRHHRRSFLTRVRFQYGAMTSPVPADRGLSGPPADETAAFDKKPPWPFGPLSSILHAYPLRRDRLDLLPEVKNNGPSDRSVPLMSLVSPKAMHNLEGPLASLGTFLASGDMPLALAIASTPRRGSTALMNTASGGAFPAGDDVEAQISAVDGVDVCVASRAPQDLVPGRTPSSIGM